MPARRNINLVPMDPDELVVDWSSGVVETNIGERITPEESERVGTDRSRQHAEELLGELFDLPEGLPPEAPWRVIGSSAGLPRIALNDKRQNEMNEKRKNEKRINVLNGQEGSSNAEPYPREHIQDPVKNYSGRFLEKNEDPREPRKEPVTASRTVIQTSSCGRTRTLAESAVEMLSTQSHDPPDQIRDPVKTYLGRGRGSEKEKYSEASCIVDATESLASKEDDLNLQTLIYIGSTKVAEIQERKTVSFADK